MKLNFRLKTFLVTLGCFLLWKTIWGLVGSHVSQFLFFWLSALHVFPRPVIYLAISLLPLAVTYEVIAKLVIVSSIPDKVVYEPVQLETIPQINLPALDHYTDSLKLLGFRPLLDYQLVESSTGAARVFSHPELHCFVEVSQFVGRLPMGCVFASALDRGWTLSTTDRQLSSLGAVWYAFLRRPRGLLVCRPEFSAEQLLQSHLELRQQMLADLNVQVLPDTTAQAFFEQTQKGRTQSKQTLWRRSVLVGMFEMLLFTLKPKTEWLGEYAVIMAQKRSSR